ncbi:MAG TPA: PilC/PilY family type IV pilus protein, partial [Pseudomonas sp.]|nr:PilC/PilY family type IV pilus protein [Pseudomonas sp.]
MARAGNFFTRGTSSTDASTLQDPYWQPPASGTGAGNELTCRQNYHMLVTDGLWNGNSDGPKTSALATSYPQADLVLPDQTKMPDPTTAGVTSIYNPVDDGGDSGYASLSDIAFYYWAHNLRPDLYTKAQSTGGFVPAYLPDQTTSVFNLSATSGATIPKDSSTNINQEIYFNPNNDPATWPHMSEYLVGLGVSGQLNFSTNTDCTDTTTASAEDACDLRKGTKNSSGASVWPTPDGTGSGIAANIDDTWHAALAGRGQFFSAGNPQELVTQLSNILTSISAHQGNPTTNSLNTSVLVPGALAFTTGYETTHWTGVLSAVQANADGSVGTTPLWYGKDTTVKEDAGALLTDPSITDPTTRNILTSKENASGGFGGGVAFEASSASSFDANAQAELMLPAPTDTTNDTLANRIDYLRGVRTEETAKVMRTRTSLLGAIINSHAVYVGYPASGYTDNWPSGSPEATAAASGNSGDDGTYEQFVQNHISRTPVVYVGANDGMLHAFNASEKLDSTTTPPTVTATPQAGREVFAYVPRAVYGNLGNLTQTNFTFLPTVDGTPVTHDVFFPSKTTTPATTSIGWHTILVGNLRSGGRGVYALDITDPTQVKESNAAKKVLWEFSSDTPAPGSSCYSNYGTCNPADLGFTYGQPNIGRLANGKWVVLVPGGYFPNCSAGPYNATNCPMPAGAPTAGSPAVAFSSLFVLDAQTGAMIAELKTPTNISGVTSYGLGSPVLGDYNNDQ